MSSASARSSPAAQSPRPTSDLDRGPTVAIHCPECGFVNAEGANYCQKCGAYLSRPDGKDEPTTMTYTVDESGEMHQVDIDEVVERHGAALVIRSGGGRAGESFTLDDERVSIGRTPDAGSSSTTSRSRATTHCWSAARTASTSTTSDR